MFGAYATPTRKPWRVIHAALQKAAVPAKSSNTYQENIGYRRYGARILLEVCETLPNPTWIMGDASVTKMQSRRVAKDFPEIAFALVPVKDPVEPNCRFR